MGIRSFTYLLGGLLIAAQPAFAADISPTLLIETGPSDNPEYRRMVHVKYLNGANVSAHYRAYNRREFISIPDRASSAAARACAQNQATSLSEIKAFEAAEAQRKRAGQAPEVRSFCIKNISNWEARNKDAYLDPIFAGMPYVKGVN